VLPVADEPGRDGHRWDADSDRVGVPGPDRRPPAQTATFARIGGAGRGPGIIVAAVAIFLAVALIKPWPGGGLPRPTARPATPPPTQQPSADPLAAIRLDCQDPPGWRIFSRERWAGGTLRSWRSVEPVIDAAGPTDPRIPLIPISPEIVALGYCAPWGAAERPPDDVAVRAWSVAASTDGVPAAEPLTLVDASATLRPPLGALYEPPHGPSEARPALWPSGIVVFTVDGRGFHRWWAVRIGRDGS
jgi:hypothetical protein